ncbi:MAG: ABC transporter permease [Microbacterium sp.]
MGGILGVYFWSSVVGLAAPLLLAALGETLAQRAGLFTIGIEGFMLGGAFASVAVGIATGNAVAGLGAGLAVGSALGAVYALLVVTARADQVVVGIGFNLVVLGLTSLFRRTWFEGGMTVPDQTSLAVWSIPGLSQIPWLGGVLFSQSPVVYVVYLLVPVVSWVLWRSRWGLVMRAAGDGAIAASAQGVAVQGVRFTTMTVNGALCGAAGAILVLLQAGGVFADDITSGRGYVALALTMFARWLPWRVLVGALVFGAADALQYVGQAIVGDAIAPALFLMAPYLLALIAWLFMSNRTPGPRDIGVPLLR